MIDYLFWMCWKFSVMMSFLLHCTICRKPSFTGLYVQWEHFSAKKQKLALVYFLVTRAKRICSRSQLSSELAILRDLFIGKGYPYTVVSMTDHKYEASTKRLFF